LFDIISDIQYTIHILSHTGVFMSHIIAFILGIVVATVGFTGVAKMLDNGVEKTKSIVQEQVK